MLKKGVVILVSAFLFAACKTESKVIDDSSRAKRGEVLVDLKTDVRSDEVIKAFKKYSLSFEREISPQLNIGLYLFDESKIELDEIIEKLKKNENVENAQSNKKTTQRR